MNLGEFIMKNIDWITLASIIGGIAGILKVLKDNSTLKSQNDEIKKQFKIFSNQTKELILETKGGFTNEYKDLSKEHSNLSKEHILLINNSKDIKDIVGKINDRQLQEISRINNLSKNELDINKTVEHISSLMEILKLQNEKIISLENEKNKLTKENELLNIELKNFRKYEKNKDMGLEL